MFDIAMEGMKAFDQGGMLVMGLVFLLIGGGLAGYELYWRMRAVPVNGTIIGVRASAARQEDAAEQNGQAEGAQAPYPGGGAAGGKAKGRLAGTIFAVLFLAVPVLFVGIGAHTVYTYYDLRDHGKYAEATVIRYEESSDSEGGTSYYPILAFDDARGVRREVRESFGSSSQPFEVLSHVGVYYDAADPERFVVDDFGHSVGTGLAFAGFGLVCIAVLGGIAYAVKRKGSGVSNGVASDGTVRTSGEFYYPVYEYQGPNGERMEHVGGIGRNSLLGMIPGTPVRLLMMPDQPEKVRRPMAFFLILGAFFALPGAFVTYMALTQYDATPMSLLFMLAFVAFMALRIRKALGDLGTRLGDAGGPGRAGFGALGARNGEKVNVLSLISQAKTVRNNHARRLSDEEVAVRVKKNAGQALIAGYIVLLIAVGFSVGAYYAGLDMLELTLNGQRTGGEVVDVNSRYSSDSDGSGYTYYAEVAFEDAKGKRVRFEDSVGASRPLHKIGDRVSVLYDPENSAERIIDRGMMNWGLSGGLAAGALIMLLLGLNALRQGRAHGGRQYPNRI